MIPELDKIIHQPVRTRIMAQLVSHGSCDYVTLKADLELSDGHMSTHMKELVESKYVNVEKAFVNNKPKTTYSLTALGKKRFAEYVQILKSLIQAK